MGRKIFISYRRFDASAQAVAIATSLRNRFGPGQVFIDIDQIVKGQDFHRSLQKHLSQCKVMVAVIGPQWLEAKDEAGKRRLDNPADYVRSEIATALRRHVVVIPALVEGATMPSGGDLPDDLKPLVKQQAATITHVNYASDISALADSINRRIVLLSPGMKWAMAGVAAAMLAVVAGSYGYMWVSENLREAREAAQRAQDVANETGRRLIEMERERKAPVTATQQAPPTPAGDVPGRAPIYTVKGLRERLGW